MDFYSVYDSPVSHPSKNNQAKKATARKITTRASS